MQLEKFNHNIQSARIEKVAFKTFGYPFLKDFQKKILLEIFSGNDVFGVFAMSSGKSLCYQLPCLLLYGMTVVISPLKIIMEEQVQFLQKKKIAADAYHLCDFVVLREKILKNQLQILFLSPEAFCQAKVNELLSKVSISLLAIDEAHCFIQWQQFRPDYHALVKIKKKIIDSKVPLLVLTATATPPMMEKIITDLEMKNIFILRQSIFRENLAIQVIDNKGVENQLIKNEGIIKKVNFKKEILSLLMKKNPSQQNSKKDIFTKNIIFKNVLIYCFKKEEIFELESFFQEQKIQFVSYHADLTKQQKEENYFLFKNEKVNIMIASLAFGMGIDKANIRLVIHYSIPISIEDYFQQLGRAGRDNQPAENIIFYDRNEKAKRIFLAKKEINKSYLQKNNSTSSIYQLFSFLETKECRFQLLLNFFGEEKHTPCGKCDNCLKN